MSAVRPASARQRGGFVTPLAWVSLLLGAVSVLANLMQIAMIALAPGAGSLGLPEGITLPPSWQWLINHALSLSVAGVVLSAAFCWLSWALLQRREWARRSFVAVLLVTGLLNFGGVAVFGALVGGGSPGLAADGREVREGA
ncbi:hypothetical protein P2A14_23520, partial [Xanthomonas perforans]